LTGLFAGIGILILWALLAVLQIIVGVKRAMPWPAVLAAEVVIVGSALAAFEAQALLAMPANQPFSLISSPPWPLSPFLWPLVVPALIPPLVVGFSLCALTPSLRATIPMLFAGGLVGCTVLAISISVLPMAKMRDRAYEQFYAMRAKRHADLLSLPANSPLWVWTSFLDIDGSAVSSGVRRLGRRQSDAELMLDRGDFPLGYLGFFDLDPTSAICDKARGLIRRRVAALQPKVSGATPYNRNIDQEIEGDTKAMEWLAGHGCDVHSERDQAESLVHAYQDSPVKSITLEMLVRIQRKP
jgi:hypothetical protein